MTVSLVYDRILSEKRQLTGGAGVYEHLHQPGQEATWHYDLPSAGRYRIVGQLRGQILKQSGVLASNHYFTIKAALFFNDGNTDQMVPKTETNVCISKHGQWDVSHQPIDWLIDVSGPGTIDIRCALFWVGAAPQHLGTPGGPDWLGITGGESPEVDGAEGRTWFRVEGPLP